MKKIFTLLAILVTFLGMGQTYSVNYTITTQQPTQTLYKQVRDVLGNSNACSNGTVIRDNSNNYTYMSNSNYTSTSVQSFCPGSSSTNIADFQAWNYLLLSPTSGAIQEGNYTLETPVNLNALTLENNTYRYRGGTLPLYIRFQTVSTLSTFDFEKSFSVYPNPTRDVVNIDLESEVSGEVYNLTGSLVLNFTSHEVDLSTLQPGVYLMKIFSEGMQCTKKIVKQ